MYVLFCQCVMIQKYCLLNIHHISEIWGPTHSSQKCYQRWGGICFLLLGKTRSGRIQHAIPLFADAGVLSLKFSFQELTANLMFDVRHRNAPCSIQELFPNISEIRSCDTLSSASKNFYKKKILIRLYYFYRIETKVWMRSPSLQCA